MGREKEEERMGRGREGREYKEGQLIQRAI